MAKVSQTIEIEASPKECYAVISDYESYPEFLKDLKDVTIEKQSGQNAEVTFTIEVIKRISYTLKMHGKPPAHLSWSFIKGEIIKDNKGEWVLEELDDGCTKATYNVEVSFGLLVPGAVAKALTSSNLPAMLQSFKKRIEGSKKGKKK
jgi:coenzyme Q-binding protein COQ10